MLCVGQRVLNKFGLGGRRGWNLLENCICIIDRFQHWYEMDDEGMLDYWFYPEDCVKAVIRVLN